MLFILKKKKEKEKKKNVSNKRVKKEKAQLTNPFSANRKGEEELQEDSGSKGPQCLKNFMNFLKIIFIWQQVTLKNLLSRRPDMEIQ